MRTPTDGWGQASTANDDTTGIAAGHPADRLHWVACDFDTLGVHRLHAVYAARQQVFVVEQNCAYLDVDGRDADAYHLSAWLPGTPLPWAYARVLAPGAAYVEASVGRVLTTAPARGSGLGRQLVQRAVDLAQRLHPASGIRISAQHHLQRFYAGFGFTPVGDIYLEDGIPHIEMVRAAGTSST